MLISLYLLVFSIIEKTLAGSCLSLDRELGTHSGSKIKFYPIAKHDQAWKTVKEILQDVEETLGDYFLKANSSDFEGDQEALNKMYQTFEINIGRNFLLNWELMMEGCLNMKHIEEHARLLCLYRRSYEYIHTIYNICIESKLVEINEEIIEKSNSIFEKIDALYRRGASNLHVEYMIDKFHTNDIKEGVHEMMKNV